MSKIFHDIFLKKYNGTGGKRPGGPRPRTNARDFFYTAYKMFYNPVVSLEETDMGDNEEIESFDVIIASGPINKIYVNAKLEKFFDNTKDFTGYLYNKFKDSTNKILHDKIFEYLEQKY